MANRHDEIEVPALVISGWFGNFQQGALDNYVAMRSRGKTARLAGPWTHSGNLVASLPGGSVDVHVGMGSMTPGGQSVTDLELQWCDYWLIGEPATAAHDAGVLLFVMGINQWRPETDWPFVRERNLAAGSLA
ncbi:CocE/NonD family hydrolase [Arthrobacter sp. ISL-5]|nr:CocE/NonD family hydrolase [Arthrobacter sp. ISL-5]